MYDEKVGRVERESGYEGCGGLETKRRKALQGLFGIKREDSWGARRVGLEGGSVWGVEKGGDEFTSEVWIRVEDLAGREDYHFYDWVSEGGKIAN